MYISLTNNIFGDINKLKDFLIENQILPLMKNCVNTNCFGQQKLIIYNDRDSKILIYRCETRLCRKRSNILKTKFNITKYIHILYMIFTGCSYKQLNWYFGVADTTIVRFKKTIRELYKKYLNDRPVLVGGIGVTVEIDETVISRRGTISNPTSTSDNVPDTAWIIGAIDNTPARNFLLLRVLNRQVTTLTNALDGKIGVGSILHSDGYPSYPSVASNLGLNHRIVNHSVGFVAPDGVHTNNQEGFWAHFKSSMRKENGVMRSHIDEWISEYIFKRRYMVKATKEDVGEIFLNLLRYLFYY